MESATGGADPDAEHVKTKQENQLLLKKLHDVVTRYKQLQQQYQAVVAEKEQLVGSSSSSSTAAASDGDQTASEMAAQDAAVKKLETEKHELIEKLKHVVGTCRVMQKQLQEAKEENEILKSPAKPLANGSSSSTSNNTAFAAAARITALEQELALKEEEKQELIAKLQEVIARYHALQMQLEEKIGEHEAAISKVRALELELSTRGSAEAAQTESNAEELSTLRQRLEQLSSQLEGEQTRVAVANEENVRLKEQLAAVIDDNQTHEREMRRQLQDAQHDTDRLVSKVSELQHQAALMQQQQEDTEQLYTEVASRLNQTLRLNGELEERLAAESSKQSQVQELETLLAKATNAAEELKNQFDSEATQWQRERSGFVDKVSALSMAHETASARIKHLEELQSQLEGPDVDVNYEILLPSIDFPKREEIQALALQVNSLTSDSHQPSSSLSSASSEQRPPVDLAIQYDDIRFQMSHIRKRQNSLLAEKENDVLELEQLRETISNLVDEHQSSLREKDAELKTVVTKLEEDRASLQSSIVSLTDKLVDTEAVAHRDAEKILYIRSQLVVLIGSPSLSAGDEDDTWDVEQILSNVKETVDQAEELRNTVNELTESISALQEQLTASSDQSGDTVTRFEGEVQSLTAALQASHDENERLNAEINTFRELEYASEESERLSQELAFASKAQATALSVPSEPVDSALSSRHIAELEQELERAKSSLEESESMIASVKAENMRMIFEVAKTADGSVKLRQDYEQLLDQQKDKAVELETLMRELEVTIAAKLELESELRESQGSLAVQIHELNSEKQELRDEVSRLEEDLERLRKEKEGLEKAILDLKNENDTLEERINELNAGKSDYDSTEEKDREVEELRSSLVQAKVDYEQQTRQLSALEKKVAEVSTRSGSPSGNNNAAATEAERKEFHAALMELIDMEKKLQAAYETQKNLEAALKEKSESKALLEAKLADAEQNLADLEDELEHKMRVSGTIETHLKHTESENQDLMKEHEQVLAKLVQTENLLEEKTIEFEAFRTTSDMLKDERSRLFNEIASLKEQNLELGQQSERAAEAQDEAQQELEEQLTELADKIAQLETDKSEMKQALEREIFHLEDEIVEVKGWRQRAEDENLLLHSRIGELEASIQDLEANSCALEAQNVDLAKELEAAHESFTLQIGEMETQVEHTMTEMTMAMRDKEDLELGKSSLEAAVSTLEAEKIALALEFAAAKTSFDSNVDELQLKLTAVEEQLGETEDRFAQATGEAERKGAEIAELSDRNTLLEQEIEAATLAFTEKSEALKAEMSALMDEKTAQWRAVESNQQDEIAGLSGSLEAKQRELDALAEQWTADKESRELVVSDLQTQIEALQAQNVVVSSEKESAEDRVASLETGLRVAEVSLKEANDRFGEKEIAFVAVSAELAELQTLLEEKTASYKVLCEERASLETQLDDSKNCVRDLEEQVAEKEEMGVKVASLKQKLATSKASLKEVEAHMAEKHAMHEALAVESVALQAELDQVKVVVAQLQDQVTESETRAVSLEQTVTSSRLALEETEELLTAKTAALAAEQALLQAQALEHEASLRQLEEQIAAEKTSADATVARLEDALASSTISLQDAEERVSKKTAAYEEVATKHALIQTKLTESAVAIRHLEELVAENESASVQVTSLQQALASSQSSLQEVNKRLAEKELALDSVAKELAELRSSHDEKHETTLNLTVQQVALETQLAHYESSSQQLRDEINSLQTSGAAAQASIRESVAALTASELRVAELTRQCEELRSSVQANELALETLGSEKASLQNQVEEHEVQVRQSQQEGQQQALELTKSQEHVTRLSLQIQELEEARAAHSQERELQLSTDLEAAQAQIAALSESLQAASVEFEELGSKSEEDATKFATALAQRDQIVVTLKAKIEDVVASYKRLKEHAVEVQDRLTQQVELCGRITQELEDAKSAILTQAKELHTAQQELAVEREQTQALSVELRDATAKLQDLQTQRDSQVEGFKSRMLAYEEQISSLKAHSEETVQKQHAEFQTALGIQRDELTLKLAELEQSKAEMIAIVQLKETEAQEVLDKMREIVTRYRKLQEKHRDLELAHANVTDKHESVTTTSEAELSAATATIEQLRVASSVAEAEHAVVIARVESEAQTLRLQLDVEIEAATAARTALEVYKKRAHTALKKATSESKLNVKKASEETVVLEQRVLEATARVGALESELVQAQRTIADLSAATELRIHQAVEAVASERRIQEATWKSETTALQAELLQVQTLLKAKATLDLQITELFTERDALKSEMETLRRELQQKSELAREMMKVKDGEIAQLVQQLQASVAAAATATASMSPLRIDNNSDAGSRNSSPPARKDKSGASSSATQSPTSHSDTGDTSRSSSVDPAEEMHSHITAAVAENRSIPLLAAVSSDSKSSADVDEHILKLTKVRIARFGKLVFRRLMKLVAHAVREEEALQLKKQLAALEERARLSLKQYQDTHALLEEANRQKKRLQLLSERNTEGVNIEYLKNVVIKYIESSNGSEKERLIPVIATVLQFTPQEVQKVSQKVQEDAGGGGLLGGVFSLFGGGGGASSPAPKPLASLSRQPSTSTISGGPKGFRFDEPDEREDASSLNPFAS